MEDQCSVVGPPAKIPKLEAMETEAVNVTRGGTTHALGKELQSSMYRGGGVTSTRSLSDMHEKPRSE